MPQTISKIGIKNSSGTGYDTRDIGAKGQNVEVGYNASGKIILDVDAQTPTTTKQLTKVLQDVEKNISDLENSKGTSSHAWTDADGVNYGLADGTHYGHIKVGNGLTVNSGKVDVAYGNSANTACQGNDSRLSNARKNPNAVTFSNGTTNVTYDGSAAKTVTAATVGAAPAGHTSVQATNSILGHVKTGTGITNNSGTISVSYGTAAGTACQGNDSRLSDSRTPKSHATTTTTYGGGNSSNYGHVKLTDTYSVTTPNASTNGANTGIAASAYALQQAYSTLNSNLSANNNHFYFDYKDGKYGYNTDPSRGADTFVPFRNTEVVYRDYTNSNEDIVNDILFTNNTNAPVTVIIAMIVSHTDVPGGYYIYTEIAINGESKYFYNSDGHSIKLVLQAGDILSMNKQINSRAEVFVITDIA